MSQDLHGKVGEVLISFRSDKLTLDETIVKVIAACQDPRCSFCGKVKSAVPKLIISATGAGICSLCHEQAKGVFGG